MAMLVRVLRQLRHWMEMRVALARTPDAEMMIPGIFTRCDIMSDYGRIVGGQLVKGGQAHVIMRGSLLLTSTTIFRGKMPRL